MRLCFLIVKHSQKSITPGFNRILLPAILLDYYQTYPMIMICHQNNLSRLWLLLLNVWKFWNNQKHHHLCCKHSSIHLDNFLKLYLPLLATLSIKGEFHLDWIMYVYDERRHPVQQYKNVENFFCWKKTVNEQPPVPVIPGPSFAEPPDEIPDIVKLCWEGGVNLVHYLPAKAIGSDNNPTKSPCE